MREEHKQRYYQVGWIVPGQNRRDVTELALRSLLRFLPVRVTPRGKLMSNLAEAPKDNCFDLKSRGEPSAQTG